MWSLPIYRVVADTFRLPGDETIVSTTSAEARITQRNHRFEGIRSTSPRESGCRAAGRGLSGRGDIRGFPPMTEGRNVNDDFFRRGSCQSRTAALDPSAPRYPRDWPAG